MTPEVIAEKVIPRLKSIIRRSEGRYSNYVLWPEFQIGYEPPSDEMRPKRNKQNQIKIGDIPLEIGGVSIGKIELAIPWLNPAAWSGLGLPLVNINTSSQRQTQIRSTGPSKPNPRN